MQRPERSGCGQSINAVVSQLVAANLAFRPLANHGTRCLRPRLRQRSATTCSRYHVPSAAVQFQEEI